MIVYIRVPGIVWDDNHEGIITENPPRKDFKLTFGTIINLETGDVIQDTSSFPKPAWLNDPLLRALKLAQFKQQQKHDKRKKTGKGAAQGAV